MTDLFGHTRTVLRSRCAVLSSTDLATTALPGWEKAACQVMISPALGAGFTQIQATLEREGQCQGNTGPNQYFAYLLEGSGSIVLDERRHRLEVGNFCYLPPGQDMQLKSGAAATRVLILQKRYLPLAGANKPKAFVGHEREAKSQPFRGCQEVRSQPLLPADPAFDMSVDLLTWPPGAALPSVQSDFREQGLLLTQGRGLQLFEEDWHPVRARDAVWIGPYCPQWFVAVGVTPATAICFQVNNRDPV